MSRKLILSYVLVGAVPILLLVTLLLTVFADLTIAIGTGVALGFILRWWKGRGARLWTPRER